MKTAESVCLSVLLFAAVSASVYAYDYLMSDRLTSWSIPWTAASTQITTLTGGDWDDGYYNIALGANFEFFFYGMKVTHIKIWTNGYVTFGFGSAPADSVDSSNDPIPSNNNPNSYAAPWWDDWDLTSSGGLYYTQWNAAGYYFTKVEWRGVPHHDGGGAVTFMVTLFSHTHNNLPDVILFQYDDVVVGSAAYDYGAGATVGVEHPMGTQARWYSYNEAELSTSDKIYFVPFVPIYGGTENIWDWLGTPAITLFRPEGGYWFHYQSNGTTRGPFQWGQRGDVPLPGDYDGDGDADHCVLRPDTYTWFCQGPTFAIQFGDNGDIPVPADFDGNVSIDLAVFRPNGGWWCIFHRDLGTSELFQWGTQGDIPLPADYDNDGKADCAVFRPSTNTWFIRRSSNPAAPWVIAFGTDGDIPMPTNIQTPSYATLSVFRPGDGNWYAYNQFTGTSIAPFNWGQTGDAAVPGDEDGGGNTNAAVFRPLSGFWFIKNSVSFPAVVAFGTIGDIPMFRRNFLNGKPATGNPDH